MLFDGIKFLADSSVAVNFKIEHGTTFPTGANTIGELFYLTGEGQGIYVHTGNAWVAAAPNTGGGDSTGEGAALPTSQTFTYDAEGRVSQISEIVSANERLSIFTYTATGSINTLSVSYLGSTRTETYSYNTDGLVIGMSATTS